MTFPPRGDRSRREFLRGTAATGIATIGGLSLAETVAASTYTVDTDLRETLNIAGAELDAAVDAVSPGSPLVGLGETWVDVGNSEGINAVYMAAHAAHESAWGRSNIAQSKQNIYGWGAYDSDPYDGAKRFGSFDECVRHVMPRVREWYLTPGGRYYNGSTLRGMNVRYATDDQWAAKIASIMNSLADELGASPPSDDQWPVYRRGDGGRDVYTIQYLLRARGYSLVIDGSYGPETERTVQSFQSARGLTVDGIVGPATWGSLVVTVSRGDEGDAVRAAQDQLGITVDGIFGPATESATEDFQSTNGLAVDGIVGPNTWKALVG
ncbi:peptidoglycan-binding protein (plasmid) [Haloferacaceae archaeon DSL9]